MEGFRLEIKKLTARRGEYLVVMGPSGVGKTILLHTIAGLLTPLKGRIMLGGRDVTHTPPEEREVSIVPQNYALWPHMSVYDNIAYGLRAKGASKETIEEKVEALSNALGIKHLLRKKPGQLSGGEQQRVALARALAVEPMLLLLDEPTAELDPGSRLQVWKLLKELHGKLGFTALHVTHNIAEALYLGDKIAYMEEGRLIDVTVPEKLVGRKWAKNYLREYAHIAEFIDRRGEEHGI